MTGEAAAAAVVEDGPVDVNAAVNNAADDVNAKTPDPPPVPLADVIPTPPADPVDADTGLKALTDTVAGLVSTVEVLKDVVLGKVDNDDSPKGGGPWTHRFGRKS